MKLNWKYLASQMLNGFMYSKGKTVKGYGMCFVELDKVLSVSNFNHLCNPSFK